MWDRKTAASTARFLVIAGLSLLLYATLPAAPTRKREDTSIVYNFLNLVYIGLIQINLSIESDDFYLDLVTCEECVISERRKGSSALVRAYD